MTKAAEIYACLYVKEFPAQTLLRLRPELQSKACVVMEGKPPLQTVCSLNTKARLLGIERGMTQVEVDTFSEVAILTRSQQTEAAAKAILLECAGAFSPRIEDCSEDASQLCGIDITGTRGLFGPPEILARSLLQRVRSLGFSSRVAISSNFHTAICMARGQTQGGPIQVILLGTEAQALSSLPLAILDMTEVQREIFTLWGIRTLGLLADLPEKELIARMGQGAKRLRQLARGEMPHLFQPVEPAFTLEERIELDTPVELLESLLFVIGVMLDQLILRAKARILALASITMTLSLEGAGSHTRIVRPALPSTDKQLWIKLLHLDLEAHAPSAAILNVVLHAEPGSTSKVQLGLFSPQLPEAARLDVTLARVKAILGEENVGCAVLEDTHAPKPYRIEPFTVPSNESAISTSEQSRTAVRQLRPPEAISVTLRDAQPTHFWFRERRYTVEHVYGPWRVSGDWWNSTLWGMEQWDLVAHAHDGAMLCCSMLHDLMHKEWQMAGLYD